MKHSLKIMYELLNSPLQISFFTKYILLLLASDINFLRKISATATCLIFIDVKAVQLALDIITTE